MKKPPPTHIGGGFLYNENMKEKKLWFKAKNYGWGWYPASREGWFVMLWYITALLVILRKINSDSRPANDTIIAVTVSFLAVTAILIFICYKTGEKPEWRWGKKEDTPK